MDLGALLDVTEPVECEFMDHKITAHVYTAGVNRLRKEDRDKWDELNATGRPNIIPVARTLLPLMISSWDLDSTPMEWPAGSLFPPTPENVARCPDALLVAVANPVIDKWNKQNPTDGVPLENGSGLEETSKVDEPQALTTTA